MSLLSSASGLPLGWQVGEAVSKYRILVATAYGVGLSRGWAEMRVWVWELVLIIQAGEYIKILVQTQVWTTFLNSLFRASFFAGSQ